MRQYVWLARSRPIRLLLLAWFLSYASAEGADEVVSARLEAD